MDPHEKRIAKLIASSHESSIYVDAEEREISNNFLPSIKGGGSNLDVNRRRTMQKSIKAINQQQHIESMLATTPLDLLINAPLGESEGEDHDEIEESKGIDPTQKTNNTQGTSAANKNDSVK